METSTKYSPQLDGLRAVAAFAVVAWHCDQKWASGGSLGVDVFFVLSGWLITRILASEIERTGRVDFKGFMARRVRRLVPALMAMLLAVVVIWPSAWPDVLASATYLLNWFVLITPAGSPLAPVGHTWTLAVEMQFYLLWPFVLPALLRMPRKKAATALLVAWEVASLARTLTALGMHSGPLGYYPSVFRSTGFLLGAWAALYPPKVKWGGVALALLAACLGLADTLDHFGRFLLFVPAVEILTALVLLDPPRLLSWPPLPALGRVSYGVYLWHVPLTYLIPGKPFAAVAGGATVLAALSWALIERPFMRNRQARRPELAA